MPNHSISLVFFALASYLIGSIPFSFLVPKVFAQIDIRQHGSGNPGASNVARICGKPYGFLSLSLDVAKGIAAVFLLQYFALPLVLGTLAILGHITTPFLKFSGGKGVATTLGCISYISWPAGLVFVIAWATALTIWNYAGLSSLLAICTTPIVFLILGVNKPLLWTSMGLVALIFLTHRKNIERLVTGGEHNM